MKISYIKLVTGEEIIAEAEMVELNNKKYLKLYEPYVMHHYLEPERGMRDYAFKFMPLSNDNKFLIRRDHIVALTSPSSTLCKDYMKLLERKAEYEKYDEYDEYDEYDDEFIMKQQHKSNNEVTLH